MSKLFDTHSLYIYTQKDSEEEIYSTFKNLFPESEYYINIVYDKNLKPLGFGYIYVTNSDVFWKLLNKDKYGNNLSKIINNPNWKKLEGDSYTEKKLKLENRIKSIREELEIIKETEYPWWGPYSCKDDELKKAIKNYNNFLNDIPDKISIDYKIDYGIKYEYSRAFCFETDYNLSKSLLISKKIPDWLKVEDFLEKFKKFNSSRDEKYPLIDINNNDVYIKFDSLTNDASFSLLFLKKIDFEKNNQKVTLIFYNSYIEKQHNINNTHPINNRNNSNKNKLKIKN